MSMENAQAVKFHSLYVAANEVSILEKALARHADNPADFTLTEDEWIAFLDGFMRREASALPIFAPEPNESPAEKITKTLDAQILSVQNQIRRNEVKLAAAILRGEQAFKEELELCKLRPSLISSDTILICLRELKMERFDRTMLGYAKHDLTIEQQAMEKKLEIVEPDRRRGVYVGLLVGIDHRAGLVKLARGKALIVPLPELFDGPKKIKLGKKVRLDFKDGVLTTTSVN